jgi:hypothetical protein
VGIAMTLQVDERGMTDLSKGGDDDLAVYSSGSQRQ